MGLGYVKKGYGFRLPLTSETRKFQLMNLLLYMASMAAMILLPFTLYIEGNVTTFTLEKAKDYM